MKLIRNLLALIGLVALLATGYGYFRLAPLLSEFDPGFMATYGEFASKLMETGDPGVLQADKGDHGRGLPLRQFPVILRCTGRQADARVSRPVQRFHALPHRSG